MVEWNGGIANSAKLKWHSIKCHNMPGMGFRVLRTEPQGLVEIDLANWLKIGSVLIYV